MTTLDIAIIIVGSAILFYILKGIYDIHISGTKAHLKNNFIIKYGLPLLCALLLLPYIYKII